MIFTLKRFTGAVAIGAVSALLAGCSAEASSSSSDGVEGFEYGASQEDVNAAIKGLDPVDLVFQSTSSSPEALNAAASENFAEAIEERSNGQISVEIAWGYSASGGLEEAPDALADGRIDITPLTLTVDPSRFPIYDALNGFSKYVPSSPVEGVFIASGMAPELAWQSDALMQEFEDNQLTPLNPASFVGDYYNFCNHNMDDFEQASWEGQQMRAGNTLQISMVEAVGATPVSLEWTEVYDALQRGVMDCTMTLGNTSVPVGLLEVAPNVAYAAETTFGGAFQVALVAGSSFDDLPLPYQQIIFDAQTEYSAAQYESIISSHLQVVELAESEGGALYPVDGQVAEIIDGVLDDYEADVQDKGYFDDSLTQTAEDLADKWTKTVHDLGIKDGGDMSTIHEWYEHDEVDFRSVAETIFEESVLPHRPQ